MVRLNKNLLTDKQLDNLFSQFSKLLNTKDQNRADDILREILGPEERIMIAKRLAIVILSVEGHSFYSISRNLKVSPATAQRIKLEVDKGRYQNILSRLGKSKKDYFAILDAIDSILHLGGLLPHYGNSSEGWRIVENLLHR